MLTKSAVQSGLISFHTKHTAEESHETNILSGVKINENVILCSTLPPDPLAAKMCKKCTTLWFNAIFI